MRLAIVTGASRGIGRATAVALARRGVGLLLVGRDSPEKEQSVRLASEAGAPLVRTFTCDLADADGTERAVRALLEEFPEPEVLVNNAGVVRRALVEEMSTADWNETLDVNLRAPFILARAVVPSMRRAGRGRILFVGSIGSTIGTARHAAYAASKWGTVGLMKSLAEELSGTGVGTLAVLPGSTDTQMLEGSGFPPRMTADDVAQTIVHFALDAPAAHAGGVIEMFGT